MNNRWPAGIALALAGWYASDSLRHRRELKDGYRLRGEELERWNGRALPARVSEAVTKVARREL